jgi:hypothetical protein
MASPDWDYAIRTSRGSSYHFQRGRFRGRRVRLYRQLWRLEGPFGHPGGPFGSGSWGSLADGAKPATSSTPLRVPSSSPRASYPPPTKGKAPRFRPDGIYWRTRCVAEPTDQGYAFLRLTCACGRITDYPFRQRAKPLENGGNSSEFFARPDARPDNPDLDRAAETENDW